MQYEPHVGYAKIPVDFTCENERVELWVFISFNFILSVFPLRWCLVSVFFFFWLAVQWLLFKWICASLFLLSLKKSILFYTAGAYIKNELTGLLFSDANPMGFQVLSEKACMWQLHWFGERLQSPVTFCKLGDLLLYREGCSNYNWQELSMTKSSVF